LQGNRHGYGIFKWPSGTEFLGQWKLNKREGFGYHRWANGEEYYGEFKEDTLWGKGV